MVFRTIPATYKLFPPQPPAAKTISVDYEEILQRAVAVIENARTSVARHLANTASNTYWEIEFVVSYPSLQEQQSIVATLDSLKSKVNRLQANYDKISQECDALKQAI